MFSASSLKLLESLYKQLYPSLRVAVSPFYTKSGRVTIGGQLLGSQMNRNSANASSVIMEFWPTSGSNLSTINYSRMSVGVVQEYYKNTVTLGKENTMEEKNEHVLAYVVWKKAHS